MYLGSCRIEDAGCYVSNIDINNATNNTSRQYITGSTLHALVVNDFGQKATDLLAIIESGHDPLLSQNLESETNPGSLPWSACESTSG